MEFNGNEQFRRKAGTPEQASVPASPETKLSSWAEQSHDLIDQIDGSHQLQETLPGVQFSEDLKQLLDPTVIESRAKLITVLDTLYNDLTFHEFMIGVDDKGEEYIHMANEQAPAELGKLFQQFSDQLSQFPIPGFDKELVEKRNRLVEAFKDRGSKLVG